MNEKGRVCVCVCVCAPRWVVCSRLQGPRLPRPEKFTSASHISPAPFSLSLFSRSYISRCGFEIIFTPRHQRLWPGVTTRAKLFTAVSFLLSSFTGFTRVDRSSFLADEFSRKRRAPAGNIASKSCQAEKEQERRDFLLYCRWGSNDNPLRAAVSDKSTLVNNFGCSFVPAISRTSEMKRSTALLFYDVLLLEFFVRVYYSSTCASTPKYSNYFSHLSHVRGTLFTIWSNSYGKQEKKVALSKNIANVKDSCIIVNRIQLCPPPFFSFVYHFQEKRWTYNCLIIV